MIFDHFILSILRNIKNLLSGPNTGKPKKQKTKRRQNKQLFQGMIFLVIAQSHEKNGRHTGIGEVAERQKIKNKKELGKDKAESQTRYFGIIQEINPSAY